MMVGPPLSPLSPDSTNHYADSSDNDAASVESGGRSHRYKITMTARARQRRMRRMKDRTEDERRVITPDSNHHTTKYTERSLSASRHRRRSNSNSRKTVRQLPSEAVSPASKESDANSKATSRTNNICSDKAKNVYKHEIPASVPSTPNPDFPRTVFPTVVVDREIAQTSFYSKVVGTPGNDTTTTSQEVSGALSDATTPSIIQREDIYHHKAAANIVRLLTPDIMLTASPGLDKTTAFDKSSWQMDEFGLEKFAGAPNDEEFLRRALATRMIAPSQQLADLLCQINRDDNAIPEIGRAYATRRKNACGAIKVLASKEENRLKLCWTKGLLDAISSVLNDVQSPTLDELSFNANNEARNRIVSVLLHLASHTKNRMLICNTTKVLKALTTCIAGDEGEARQGCCMVLLQLAKTTEARPLIIKTPLLLDTLSRIIEVPKMPPPQFVLEGMTPRKGYQNPYLKIFESHLSPTDILRSPASSQAVSSQSRSFRSPKSPDGTMYSRDQTTCTDSEMESPRIHGRSFLISNDTDTTSADDTMYSHEDVVTDTEDEASCVSSKSSGSSRSGSGTHGTHAEDNTESSQSKDWNNEGHEFDRESPGPGSCIILQSMSEMEICFRPSMTEKKQDDYDADPNQYLHGSRLNILGLLLCLAKSKDNAYDVARSVSLVKALIGVSKRHNSPSHTRTLTILAHLTRHPQNCHHLVFNYPELLPMLQNATESNDAYARKYALCSIQNLSTESSCKTTIAHTTRMMSSLIERCNGETSEEVHAAVATLQNLSDDSANLIQFTIVKNCIGTIVSLSQSNKERMAGGIETHLTQFMAHNTLAKLSYWLRKIATSASQRNNKLSGFPPSGTSSPLYDAVLQPTEYDQWK